MPPAKKTARKVTKTTSGRPSAKKSVRKSAKRLAKRSLSPSHKKALAEGRTMSATVNRYLSAVNTPKKRGREVSAASLNSRLVAARARLRTSTGVDKVMAAQEVRDLQARLAQVTTASTVDVKILEAAFVKVAKQFGENRGIGYGTWRDAGVPAQVLKRAGIARSRG